MKNKSYKRHTKKVSPLISMSIRFLRQQSKFQRIAHKFYTIYVEKKEEINALGCALRNQRFFSVERIHFGLIFFFISALTAAGMSYAEWWNGKQKQKQPRDEPKKYIETTTNTIECIYYCICARRTPPHPVRVCTCIH